MASNKKTLLKPVKSLDDIEKLYSRKDLSNFGTRHTLALMGFLCFSAIFTMRVNLNVAILAMVKKNESSNNNESIGSCPYRDEYDSGDLDSLSAGEFYWDERTQGLILGSFYYGYAFTNFIGGRTAEIFGSRLVVGLGIIVTSVFTLLIPIAARMSSNTLIGIRILQGLSDSFVFPGITKIVADYYPQQERSKFTSVIFLGAFFGIVMSFFISGILSDTEFLGGWPSVFYVFGGLGLVTGVFWYWLIRDDPSTNPRISKAELSYIMEGIPGARKRKEKLPVPWKSIFTCIEFYAVAAIHFGNNWAMYTLLTQMPTYLNQILHFNIKTNGIISSLPYMGTLLFGLLYSTVIDQMIIKGKISILNVRRLSAILHGYGIALMLLLMCFVNCNSYLAMVILVICGMLNGCHPCGFLSSYADISPRFAGTLIGLANTFATIPCSVSPSITGAITLNNQTVWAWRQVFIIAAFVLGSTATFYIIKIDVKVKEWNSIPSDKEDNPL